MKNKTGIVLFLLLTLILGCGPHITKGIVVDRDFIPKHTVEDSIMIDENTSIPITTIVPDAWYITFENVVEERGKVHRTVKVSKNTYNDYKVGDWYDTGEKTQ